MNIAISIVSQTLQCLHLKRRRRNKFQIFIQKDRGSKQTLKFTKAKSNCLKIHKIVIHQHKSPQSTHKKGNLKSFNTVKHMLETTFSSSKCKFPTSKRIFSIRSTIKIVSLVLKTWKLNSVWNSWIYTNSKRPLSTR